MSANDFDSRPLRPYSPAYHYRQRQQRRASPQRDLGHLNLPPGQVFDWLGDHEHLLAVADKMRRENGPAAGIDGVRFPDLSRAELAGLLRELVRDIQDGSYGRGPSRRLRIPKKDRVSFRTLSIPALLDRIVAGAVNLALKPHWEQILLPCCYGFRPHRSVGRLLAELEAAAIMRNAWVLAIADIANAFDNVPISALIEDHRQTLTDPRLLNLVEVVLRGATVAHTRKEHGIEQGNPYSPTGLNIKAHYTLDLPWTRVPNPLLFRWADDLTLLAASVTEGRNARSRLAEHLARDGFRLKDIPQNQEVVDLRQATAQLLGYTVAARPDGTGLWITLGDQARTNLEDRLNATREHRNPTETARNVILGWVTACGPTTECTRYDEMSRIVSQTAAQCGFRESVDQGRIRKVWKEARRKWQQRERVRGQECLGIQSVVTADA